MAEFKPIRTDSSHLNTTDIPIEDGKIIFVLDTNEIYIDKTDNSGVTPTVVRERQNIGINKNTNELFNIIDGNGANSISSTALASVRGCHIEGANNTITAVGMGYIHIEGYTNTDEGSGAGCNHIEGYGNINKSTSGEHHIEGYGNINYSSGPANHLSGYNNKIYGTYSYVSGSGNEVGTFTTSVVDGETIYNPSSAATASAAFGQDNKVQNNHGFVIGQNNVCVSEFGFIGGILNKYMTDDVTPQPMTNILFAIGNGNYPGGGAPANRSNIIEATYHEFKVYGDCEVKEDIIVTQDASIGRNLNIEGTFTQNGAKTLIFDYESLSSPAHYNVGSIIAHQDSTTHVWDFYRCNTANTSGAWDSTKWDLVGASQNDIDDIEDILDAMNTAIAQALAGNFTTSNS